MMRWITEYRGRGLSQARICRLLGISTRTVQRWKRPESRKQRGGNPRPYNALTDGEKAVRSSLIARRELADATCRDLSFFALEKEGVYVSAVSFHRHLVRLGIQGERMKRRRRPGGMPPAKDWVTGPNQLWCWDATRLKTFLRWKFYYLFMLQDWFSAFVVAWVLVDRERSHAAVELWDDGLTAQGLLDGGNVIRPKSLSDRGSPMRSRQTRMHLSQLQVEQLFSRPRTPNDNPLVESTYSVLKTRLNYPERLGNWEAWHGFVTPFFRWYNFEHKHSRKGFVTPDEVHRGVADDMIRARKEKVSSLLAERKRINLESSEPATIATGVD